MLTLDIPFAGNTPGTDTQALLFARIQAGHPELSITPTTHYIRKIQGFGPKPSGRTVVVIGSLTDKHFEQRFVYNRYPVAAQFTNPLFTQEEIPTVQGLDELALLEYLTDKLGINLAPADFVVKQDGITYTGGYVVPNWRIVSKPDSPFWYGDHVIWMHSGAPFIPPDGPADEEYYPVQLFPQIETTWSSSLEQQVTPPLDLVIGKTVLMRGTEAATNRFRLAQVTDNIPDLALGAEYRVLNMTPESFVLDLPKAVPGVPLPMFPTPSGTFAAAIHDWNSVTGAYTDAEYSASGKNMAFNLNTWTVDYNNVFTCLAIKLPVAGTTQLRVTINSMQVGGPNWFYFGVINENTSVSTVSDFASNGQVSVFTVTPVNNILIFRGDYPQDQIISIDADIEIEVNGEWVPIFEHFQPAPVTDNLVVGPNVDIYLKPNGYCRLILTDIQRSEDTIERVGWTVAGDIYFDLD